MPGIDQLVGRRSGFGQDPEPGEWVNELVLGQHPVGNRRAADPVKPVAAGDEVTLKLVLAAVGGIGDPRLVGLEVADDNVGDLESDLPAALRQRREQVLDHLLLRIDRDVPTRQFRDRNVLRPLLSAQVDPVVLESLARRPRASQRRYQL